MIVFSGRRFPNVEAKWIKGAGFRTDPRDGSSPVNITATGEGRGYTATTDAWWRDLAEVDLDNPTQIAVFIARRGDPSGNLDEKASASSRDFNDFVHELRDLASLWGPTDERGISRFIGSEPFEFEARMLRLALALPGRKPAGQRDSERPTIQLEAFPDASAPGGLGLRAHNLADFLFGCASHSVVARISMRRCDHCGSWFDASGRRSTARFCSGSCRTLANRTSEGKDA